MNRKHILAKDETPIQRERRLESQRKYYRTHPPRNDRQEYQRTFRYNMRDKAMDHLGGKCMFCGFPDKRALQFDHINGGGNQDRLVRKENRAEIHRSVMNNEGKYQLLCANCNWIKRHEKGEFSKSKIHFVSTMESANSLQPDLWQEKEV